MLNFADESSYFNKFKDTTNGKSLIKFLDYVSAIPKEDTEEAFLSSFQSLQNVKERDFI